jgi:hypothetical protein
VFRRSSVPLHASSCPSPWNRAPLRSYLATLRWNRAPFRASVLLLRRSRPRARAEPAAGRPEPALASPDRPSASLEQASASSEPRVAWPERPCVRPERHAVLPLPPVHPAKECSPCSHDCVAADHGGRPPSHGCSPAERDRSPRADDRRPFAEGSSTGRDPPTPAGQDPRPAPQGCPPRVQERAPRADDPRPGETLAQPGSGRVKGGSVRTVAAEHVRLGVEVEMLGGRGTDANVQDGRGEPRLSVPRRRSRAPQGARDRSREPSRLVARRAIWPASAPRGNGMTALSRRRRAPRYVAWQGATEPTGAGTSGSGSGAQGPSPLPPNRRLRIRRRPLRRSAPYTGRRTEPGSGSPCPAARSSDRSSAWRPSAIGPAGPSLTCRPRSASRTRCSSPGSPSRPCRPGRRRTTRPSGCS